MNLQLVVHSITDVLDSGSIVQRPLTHYNITILDKYGEIILAETEIDMANAPTLYMFFKDNNDYRIEGLLFEKDGILNIDIMLPYIQSSCTFTLIISNVHYNTYSNTFTVFGKDETIDIYLAKTTLGNKTVATFKVIDNPLENIKHCYWTNSSNSTTGIYIVENQEYYGYNRSIPINISKDIYAKSVYEYIVNNVITTSTHSSNSEKLKFYKFNPTLNIQCNPVIYPLIKGNPLDITIHIDLTKQVKFYKDTKLINIGKHFSIEVSIYNKGLLLVEKLTEAFNLSEVREVDTYTFKNIILPEDGEYTINACYKILGRDVANNDAIYYTPGEYIIMHHNNTTLIGTIYKPLDNFPKSKDITLLSAITNSDFLQIGHYYREPFRNNVIANYNNVMLFNGQQINIIDTALVEVGEFYKYEIQELVTVEEFFKISNNTLGLIEVESLISTKLLFQVEKLQNKEFIIISPFTKLTNAVVTNTDGVYKLIVTNEDNYYKEVIIINYPSLMNKELNYITSLLSNCIHTDTNYKQYYDIVTFKILSDIFYRILSTYQNFLYIYNPIYTNRLYSELYLMDDILAKLNNYN